MERDETRGAALVTSPRTSAEGYNSTRGIRLPLLLTARPGNVGVQIDAFRSMKMFNRPRCGKFTAKFMGINYENHSMENYARVQERTQVRARIVAERLEKLKQHEAKLIADEQSRRQRRREREAAEQRHQWLLRQAAKRVEQKEREENAALLIQCVVRGVIARHYVIRLREAAAQHSAAICLQKSICAFARRRRSVKQRQELDKERRLHAAKTIQRHARKRQASGRNLVTLAATPIERETAVPVPEVDQVVETVPVSIVVTQTTEAADAITISADPDQVVDLDLILSTGSSDSTFSPICSEHPILPLQPTRPSAHPRRPVTIKRVGGGFRHSAAFRSPRLRTCRPPDLTEAISPRPPPQRHDRSHPRNEKTLTRSAASPSAPHMNDPDEDALLDLVEQLEGAVTPLTDLLEFPTGTLN